MRNGEFSHEEVGTTNSSGDDQLHIDLSTEQIIFQHLKNSGLFILLSFAIEPSRTFFSFFTCY